MKKTIVLIAFCFFAGNLFSQKITIDSLSIKKHIQYLASDELTGRFPGTEGEKKAAEYIYTQLKSAGCEPLYQKGYQKFSGQKAMGRAANIEGSNVAFLLKGKKNPDKYIVVGAHYDHLGLGGTGSGSRRPDTVAVHNGADDNASGVSVMLECAKAIAKQKPDCSIIFVAFSAEEEGLIGSKYFIDNPPVKKEQIKAMINFDMVGYLDTLLTIEGTGTALEFDSLLTSVYTKEPFKIQRSASGYGPSDQTSFCAEKIPVLFFHTTIHEQYHTPSDDWQLINNKGAADIAGFATKIILEMAKGEKTFTYQAIGNQGNMSRSSMKVTLGILPDHVSNGDGLKINAVRPGQAAEKAGLAKGDIITSIHGEKITDIESYMNALNKCQKGETVLVDILRNNEKQTIPVAF